MIRVELHCHTYHSIDSLMLPGEILEKINHNGIDRIAITDHNSIDGALEMATLAPDRVIVGEEVKTTEGELLGYFVKEEVPRGLPPEDAIRALRDQGAFISVAHPFDRERASHWDEERLLELLPLIDAIEVFNSRILFSDANKLAEAFATQHGTLRTAGSDAHTVREIGRSSITCPDFQDADSMREALQQGEIQAKRSRIWVHFSSGRARYKKHKGWKPPSIQS